MTTVAHFENIQIGRIVDPFVSHRGALLSLQDCPPIQVVGDFAFFKLISEYFDLKIDQFGLRLVGRMRTPSELNKN